MSPLHRLYYQMKPLLPFGLRLRLRRALAKRRQRTVGGIWPIDELAGRAPKGWPGWPDGKQFALVLTHDVEGPLGLERCQQLAELEISLGFRSCFNFIPEGTYTVPPSLRDWLTDRGFEVGVHDLHHDGRLYRSREAFQRHAKKINQYLKGWGAVGFRSGSMHHNLDWLRDLNVMYDSSTFDTDPFEPQPDGVGTVFPFWVEAPEAGGQKPVAGASTDALTTDVLRRRAYLELPYTLPQDSTLFLVLGEQSIDIWKRKLDWIAAHGGMALLNVHPDYCDLPSRRGDLDSAHLTHYGRFLDHVRAHHAEVYWHVLPRRLAEFVADARPALRPVPTRRRVCMISHSFYQRDNRIIRYSESLAARGDWVDVIALRQDKTQHKQDVIGGVHEFRIQQRASRDSGKWAYLVSVLKFLVRSSCLVSWRHLRWRYDLVHVHNVPDFLVFAAWLPRLTGAKVILDIHDLLPEFYATKYTGRAGGAGYRLTCWLERLSARFADHVIISNDLWHDRITNRSVPPEKCSVFLNYLDGKLFYRRNRAQGTGKFIILFPGGLYVHQGLDLAIRGFAAVRQQMPGAEFHIYGDGDAKSELIALARRLGLNGSVQFHAPVPVQQVPDLIANADLGVVPKRADLFGNEAYSTKIVEFMSQGVPVVVARTKIDSFYFRTDQVCFFEPGNVEDLAGKLRELASNKALRETLVRNGLQHAASRNWEHKKQDYLNLVDSLCG